MTAPSPDSRKVEVLVASLVARVDKLEAQQGAQLANSSIDDGVLEVRGADGTSLATWGVQPDGTAGTKSLNKVPPPAPSSALVTPTIAGLDVAWTGQLVGNMPADFRCVHVHVSPVPDFIVGDTNYVGSMSREGSIPIAPLPYVTHYVKLTAVNMAGAVSQPSLQSSGMPSKVVADSVLDGIVTATSLADAAVTKAAVAAGAVTATAIAPESILTPHLVAGAVDTKAIAANAVQAGQVAANAITAREVLAKSLTGDSLAANTVNAGHVQAGAITAKHLETDLALTTRLIAGDPLGTRVELSESGMLVIRGDGETTFSVDASSGDVVSMGQYYTQRFGERIAMNVAGLSEPAIRAYPRRGNRYADLRSYTRTIGSTDIANWEVRLPLQGQEAGLFDFMVYDSNFNPISSSRLRYRPFFNSSGVVHCGWAADGQDCAVVYYAGEVFIVNSANSARATLRTGMLEAAGTVYAQTLRTNGGNVITDTNAGGSAGTVYCRYIETGDITYNTLKQRTSDPRRKTRRRKLDQSALAAVGSITWDLWRYRRGEVDRLSNHEADRDRIGPMADELAADPILATAVEYDADGTPAGYDLSKLVGIFGAALSDADREIRKLQRQVATLTDRLDALGATA